jgi:hypothetical protein
MRQLRETVKHPFATRKMRVGVTRLLMKVVTKMALTNGLQSYSRHGYEHSAARRRA